MNSTVSDTPPTPESATPCCALMEYVENNPAAAVVQALAVGFAVGMLVRLLESSRKEEIDVKHKPTLEETKFHLGSLVLPFLWPAWQKAQESYGKSTGALHEAVEKLKKSDLSGEGKKHLQKVEEWAQREAEHLAELGKDKAKSVEKWMEDEVLPVAECGWKKLLKFLG